MTETERRQVAAKALTDFADTLEGGNIPVAAFPGEFVTGWRHGRSDIITVARARAAAIVAGERPL